MAAGAAAAAGASDLASDLASDFVSPELDPDLGIAHGLTPASDRWVIKTIVGYAFPVPGSNSDANARVITPVNPMAHASARPFQP